MSWHEFHAFSAAHALVLGIVAFFTALACAIGVRLRGTTALRRLELSAGWLILGYWTIATIYWLLPPHFVLAVSLPIHMCDMTGLLAPLVLLTRKRLFRTLLYFWGLGLSINGILTPILDFGPNHVTFYLYWLVHASIIGTAVYDVIAGGYRPAFRDCVIAIAACAVWLATVLIVNLPLGLNYGYVGNVTPERPTLIDTLGPWPLRVFKMIFAVIVLFVAMWLPWGIAWRLSTARRTGSARNGSAAAAGR